MRESRRVFPFVIGRDCAFLAIQIALKVKMQGSVPSSSHWDAQRMLSRNLSDMFVDPFWFGSPRPGLLRDVRTRPPGRGTGGVGTVWDPYEGAQASYKVTGERSSSFESPGYCADLRPYCPATQMVLSFPTS